MRLSAVLILGQLNLMKRADRNTPPVAYAPAADVLITHVFEKKQSEAVRIAGARGLRRLALLGKLERKQVRKVANVLITSFKSAKHPWYQARLLEAMSAVDLALDKEGKPMLLDTITRAMVDTSRHPRVRATAATAVGRAALHSRVDIKVIAHELVSLTNELSLKYNTDVGHVTNRRLRSLPSHWPGTFFQIYLAFVPSHRDEPKLYQRRMNPADRLVGLNHRFPGNAVVKGAYTKIADVFRQVVLGLEKKDFKPISKNAAAGMKTWLNTHRPKNVRIHPSVPLLRPVKAAAVSPGGQAGTAARNSAGP